MDGKEGEIPPGEVKITWGRAGTQLDLELAWSPGSTWMGPRVVSAPFWAPQHQPGAGIRDPEPPTSNNANSSGGWFSVCYHSSPDEFITFCVPSHLNFKLLWIFSTQFPAEESGRRKLSSLHDELSNRMRPRQEWTCSHSIPGTTFLTITPIVFLFRSWWGSIVRGQRHLFRFWKSMIPGKSKSNCLHLTPKAQATKEKLNKSEFTKI